MTNDQRGWYLLCVGFTSALIALVILISLIIAQKISPINAIIFIVPIVVSVAAFMRAYKRMNIITTNNEEIQ